MRKYIEAVTVCVGYEDFLLETIKFNRSLFDRWLIVTSIKDNQTRELCRSMGMECLTTDEFYKDGAIFDKAIGVDRGMQLLSWKDWVLHIDADMVLPPHFRESLEDAHLDNKNLYGVDRMLVNSWEDWQKLKNSNWLHTTSRRMHYQVNFHPDFRVGTRWADTTSGWCPIGSFQMMHRSEVMWRGVRVKRYSTYGHSDASRTDIQFSLQWDRRNRVLLPEVVAVHLDSEKSKQGANWCGRTTKRFGPDSEKQEHGKEY